MASLYLQSPTYITVDELKDTTNNVDIKGLSTDDANILIYQSQLMIDSYLKKTWELKYESSQDFLFPIKLDWLSLIPNNVKIATVLVCEFIFTNWLDIGRINQDIQSERTWPRSVTLFDIDRSLVWLSIPKFAMQLLSKYKNVFYRQEL